MMQAFATLVFVAMAALGAGTIGMMLAHNWQAIRAALGLARPMTDPALPPRYRAMPARRATIMTIREIRGLRAAA